jgi:hypothetical protein
LDATKHGWPKDINFTLIPSRLEGSHSRLKEIINKSCHGEFQSFNTLKSAIVQANGKSYIAVGPKGKESIAMLLDLFHAG